MGQSSFMPGIPLGMQGGFGNMWSGGGGQEAISSEGAGQHLHFGADEGGALGSMQVGAAAAPPPPGLGCFPSPPRKGKGRGGGGPGYFGRPPMEARESWEELVAGGGRGGGGRRGSRLT